MSNPTETERLARAWIEGWQRGEPDEIPLAQDFIHTSPLGVINGRDDYLEQTKPLAAKNVVSLDIIDVVAGEGRAAIIYTAATPNGKMDACDWVECRGGKITAVTAYYDATHIPHREISPCSHCARLPIRTSSR